jgi:hypothetical protein
MELFFWNYKFAFGILQAVQNTSRIFRFLVHRLIDKIGMNSMVVETDMEVCGLILRLGNYSGWAKFGLLYLHKGNWNGNKYLMKAG